MKLSGMRWLSARWAVVCWPPACWSAGDHRVRLMRVIGMVDPPAWLLYPAIVLHVAPPNPHRRNELRSADGLVTSVRPVLAKTGVARVSRRPRCARVRWCACARSTAAASRPEPRAGPSRCPPAPARWPPARPRRFGPSGHGPRSRRETGHAPRWRRPTGRSPSWAIGSNVSQHQFLGAVTSPNPGQYSGLHAVSSGLEEILLRRSETHLGPHAGGPLRTSVRNMP